jgi:GAF domain-containing protein/HAMP domain-containing protein
MTEQANPNPESGISTQGLPNNNLATLFRITVFVEVLLALYFIPISIIRKENQFILLAAVITITSLLGILILTSAWKTNLGIQLFFYTLTLETSFVILSGSYEILQNIPFAVIALSFAMMFSALVPKSNWSDWIISLGLLGAIGTIEFPVLNYFQRTQNTNLTVALTAVATLLLIAVILQYFNGTIVATLRTKLILAALALTLIPLVILNLINTRYLRNEIQAQSNQSLAVAANQTVGLIDNFLQTSLDSLATEAELPTIVRYMKANPETRANSEAETELAATLSSLTTKQKIYAPSYGVVSRTGLIIYDTESAMVGTSILDADYFIQVRGSGVPTESSVLFPGGSREGYIFMLAPVRDENAQLLGYLLSKYNARIFQSLIQEVNGLTGAYSFAVLIDDNGLRLADGFSPNLVYRSVKQFTDAELAFLNQSNRVPGLYSQETGIGLNPDIYSASVNPESLHFFTTNLQVQGTDVTHSATVSKLTAQNWSVLYLQDQSDLNAAIQSQTRLTSGVSTLVAVIVGLAVTLAASLFSNPIVNLTDAANRITQGDLSVQAQIRSNDEIGVLGNTFNLMTKQLKEFIDTLESRVRERTEELAKQNESLQFRSKQLQTVADVARNIASTTEVDELLNTVTSLVSDRFGFYHCGIFLLDQTREFAVLRAANSAGGQRMLQRQHRLRVGQVGIVGYVTDKGEPRIATDVGEDAVFFNNPDLPETKSEMALPLKLEDQVIGALDVQSTESNAFTMEDVELFTTLSDQVSVAISNNQLFERTNQALEETQNLYRQYIRQEWTRQVTETGQSAYKYTSSGIDQINETYPEVKMVIESGRPVYRSQKSTVRQGEMDSILTVPILLNEESIGAISLQQTSDKVYEWSQQELTIAQSVGSQIAQTLENTRLFEQTLRRADRERKVIEITGKIRSTNDPQEMLRIALQELQNNLSVSGAQIIVNVPENLSVKQES